MSDAEKECKGGAVIKTALLKKEKIGKRTPADKKFDSKQRKSSGKRK